MRFFLGLVLAGLFLGFGAVVMSAFMNIHASDGWSEDAGAALFVGGMLLLIGGLILVAAIRSRNRRRKLEADQLTAVGFAHWMAMDHSDGGDDGSGGD